VSNNVGAFVELYDKINKHEVTVSPKKVSKSSKNDKAHTSKEKENHKRKKKAKKKKEETEVKEEGLEEIKLVKVLIAMNYKR
jgi:hypothetical protein